MFDLTITLGNMIEVATILGGGVLVLIKLNNNVLTLNTNMGSLQNDVGGMQEEIKKITNLMTSVAIQSTRLDGISERLNLIERRTEELRRGDGFVTGARGINREY